MHEQEQPLQPSETRHEFFVRRLKELGMYDEDSDYNGLIGAWIEELSSVWAKQGHSGMSAKITLGLFNQLMEEYTTLRPAQ